MTDLMTAVRTAVFEALDAALDPALARVFDDVPQGTEPPFVKIGSIDEEPEDDKDADLSFVTVELIHIYRGRDRGVLLAMMEASRAALRGATLAAPGVELGTARYLKASASDASPHDGVTYAGVSNFGIFAEPA